MLPMSPTSVVPGAIHVMQIFAVSPTVNTVADVPPDTRCALTKRIGNCTVMLKVFVVPLVGMGTTNVNVSAGR